MTGEPGSDQGRTADDVRTEPRRLGWALRGSEPDETVRPGRRPLGRPGLQRDHEGR